MAGWGSNTPSYGPKVVLDEAPELSACVSRTYGGDFRSPVMWRGKVTVFYTDKELFEIECTLLESKQGDDPYIAPPQRAYEDRNGEKKYQNIAYFNARPLTDAMAEAVRLELGDSSAEDDAPVPEEDGPPI